MRPVLARAALVALGLAGCGGCGDGEVGEVDPLDVDLIRELSMAQGDASGSEHAGIWTLSFEIEACDCPSVEVEGEVVDLCALGALSAAGELELELTEGSGILAIPTGPAAPFGVLTGAVASDGSFDVAAHHDVSTVVGPLEALTRLDGTFAADGTQTSGWAGQRFLGEPLGDVIDCRQTGRFTGAR